MTPTSLVPLAATEIINLAVTDGVHISWDRLIIAMLTLFIISVIKNLPKDFISKSFPYPDTKITIKHGDLLQEEGDIVIGFSDTFDTEIGAVINDASLQGQFQRVVYRSNHQQLDHDLKIALRNVPKEIDTAKTNGKNLRHPVGTIAVLNHGGKKYYCCAYAYMSADCVAQATIDNIWMSLSNLWETVRTTGEQGRVNMPVIGSGLARVRGITHTLMIKLVILSFLAKSRNSRVSKELVIVLSKDNENKVNILELNDFLESLE